MRSSPRPRAPLFLAGALLLLVAGCGSGGLFVDTIVDDPYYGDVYVDNYSPEFAETFFLAPAATAAWSGELLGYPLAPGESAYVGDFFEDYYDAEADMEFGDLVQWFDVFVYGDDVTAFEVY